MVRFWDLETGVQLLALYDKAETAAVAFAPDGKTFASAAPDGTVLIWDLKSLTRGRLEALWRELGGTAGDWIHAVRELKATPSESVAFLRERLRPPGRPTRASPGSSPTSTPTISTLREKATTELAKRGKAVEADLKKAHDNSAVARRRWRLEALLGRLTDHFSEDEAKLGAVSVLEAIGTAEARQALEEVAKGPPDVRLTREAKAALQRMNTQPER